MDLTQAQKKGNGKYLFDFEVIEYEENTAGNDDASDENDDATELEVRNREKYSIEFEVIGVV